MAKFCHECGTATQASHSHATETKSKVKVKRTRKPSAYNLEYKKQYAKLKKKHPRSKFAALAKKAHVATRRVRR
jgi:uncharacterized Zn finger protein (UPF0148 family)